MTDFGKNGLIYLVLIFLLSGQLTGAQTADFDTLSMKPGVYEGVSEPRKTEAEALLDARNSAYRNMAASFSSFVAGKYEIKQASTGKGTNPADMIVTITGDASVTVRLPLTGVEEIGKKVEQTGAGYIARVLITISEEGRARAQKYINRETTSFRAYHYFARKYNLAPLTLTDVPSGYSDYTSWLENNCLIFETRDGGSDFLDQLDVFLRKLYRNMVIFTDKLDGKPVRVIYNTPDYANEIVTALQKMHIRALRENSRVLLTSGIPLEAFKSQVQKMPDAEILVISGISSHDNRFTHISPATLNEAARIAGQNFGMHAQVSRLPDQCLNGAYNDTEIVNMLDRKNARYAILLKSITVAEPAIAAYRIPPHYRVTYQCVLHDFVTGKSIYGDTVNDVDFSSGSGGNGRITADLAASINSILENF